MKKSIVVLGILMLLLLVTLPPGTAESNVSFSFIFPPSLTQIGPEAFEGTAAETVLLPENIRVIQAHTFADMPNLKSVFLPKSIIDIDDKAFSGNNNVIFYGFLGSYAQDWAEAHGYKFVYIEACLNSQNVIRQQSTQKPAEHSLDGRLRRMAEVGQSLRNREPDEGKSMRPQERAELHDINYRFP